MSKLNETSEESVIKERIPFDRDLLRLPSSTYDEPALLGSKCRNCSAVYFPPAEFCSQCHRSDEMMEIELSRSGRLYSFTIVEHPKLAPPGFSTPFAYGYVDLPEGVRVLTALTDWQNGELKTGMDLRLHVEKYRKSDEGDQIWAFRFRPIGREDEG